MLKIIYSYFEKHWLTFSINSDCLKLAVPQDISIKRLSKSERCQSCFRFSGDHWAMRVFAEKYQHIACLSSFCFLAQQTCLTKPLVQGGQQDPLQVSSLASQVNKVNKDTAGSDYKMPSIYAAPKRQPRTASNFGVLIHLHCLIKC